MNKNISLTRSNETKGFGLGLIAIFIFASTLPITKIAIGSSSNPQLDPIFVTSFRAAGAGLLALFFLLRNGIPKIPKRLWGPLIISALGTVFGFPFFLAIALVTADPTHAAVITGLLPLGTAVSAAIYFRQKPSFKFWLLAILGAALIVVFILIVGNGAFHIGDIYLLLAVLSVSIGYVTGVKISQVIKPSYVISWALVLCLPFSGSLSALYWPAHDISLSAWLSVLYLIFFAMWYGFIIWYKALVIGGTVRVSQVQLVQPFIALILCWPLLGEIPTPVTYIFLSALMVVVYYSRRAKV